MHSTETLKRHAALVDRMAEAQGIDLEEHMLRGNMSIPQLDDAVLACTGCSQPCACEAWLQAQDGVADATPAYCKNAELFAELKSR